MLELFPAILKYICIVVVLFFSLKLLYFCIKTNLTYDRSIQSNKEIFFKQGLLLLCTSIPIYAFSKFWFIANNRNLFLSIMFIINVILVLYLNSINNSLIKELK